MTLIDGVRLNKSDAWERLVQIYAPLVFAWGKSKGLKHEDCEDIAQEVFLSVSRSISRFIARDDQPSFRPWLWAIFRHRWLDWQRRGPMRYVSLLDDVADLVIDESDSQDKIEPDQETSALVVLRGALESLRPEFATTYEFAVQVLIQGRSIEEVAEEFGRSPASVKQAAYRLRKRIKELLAGSELGNSDSVT